MCDFKKTVIMILKRKYSGIAAIAALTAILVFSPNLGDQVSAIHSTDAPGDNFPSLPQKSVEPTYTEDTIGDMKIRVKFNFNLLGDETVDSFRIFEQVTGFEQNEPNVFQLLGGTGPDKVKLYMNTDITHQRQFIDPGKSVTDFTIDVYLYKNGEDIAYRHLAYSSCLVKDYAITTLHDGDETFSGKTKFVIADAFTFHCGSYHPHCPLCMQLTEQYLQRSGESLSSSELRELENTLETWKDHPKYSSEPFSGN